MFCDHSWLATAYWNFFHVLTWGAKHKPIYFLCPAIERFERRVIGCKVEYLYKRWPSHTDQEYFVEPSFVFPIYTYLSLSGWWEEGWGTLIRGFFGEGNGNNDLWFFLKLFSSLERRLYLSKRRWKQWLRMVCVSRVLPNA